ncbi:hypothetical protein LEP1GSC058_2761 [Leptospira fainei serovar Hurstbridge str. BUT 6]|uniref:Transmembrane family 220, helix n=1 Tax=Leptospira fainei serovar Hurstbridge str. BUT 6 TaxID=1193011 RepID=S3UYY0_9LEPT|nr:transmembrane 220 family protein [Leptospira fainei]EPG73534.1 hypothetical protein LEP1GSC058_2761 [Leptospira fainei serovar Hurstbridge str. BUT 6]
MSRNQLGPFLSDAFRVFTALTWIVFAALQYNDPDPQVWIPAYLSVTFLYCLEWFPRFREPGLRSLISGISKALAGGYFLWGIYTFLEDPRADFDSEIFRESLGLGLSSIWLLLLPLFQGRAAK